MSLTASLMGTIVLKVIEIIAVIGFEQCQCGRAGSALYSLGVSFLTRQ